ncbi:MAG: type I-B CRISPR-associated protein Cas8b1/Cst1 [Thermanaerothrix sp.]|nr:type I-B CRISPR-associated protein Cas8b1/Cst1 [Thermanaerothrix sp.]
MLEFSGHPLFDVGLATIVAFNRKRAPSELNDEDLERIAGYMAANYIVDPLKTFLTVAFPNSGFTNPRFSKDVNKRKEYAERLFFSYKDKTSSGESTCVFTGKAASGIKLSDNTSPGRAFRQHVPLITGEGVINFFPWGDSGLPISGEALLAIHAFPLGCAKCEGKLLAVHSDNQDLIVSFAYEFLDYNRQTINLAQKSGSTKLPEAEASAKTLLIKTLLKIEQQRKDEASENRPSSVTAYHLSNHGANPSLEIYHLPLEITDFLSQILSAQFRREWDRIVDRGWWITKTKKTRKKEKNDEQIEDKPRRNVLYEDLFRLPDDARTFIRTYFLRIPERYRVKKDDPRATYSTRDEAQLVSWKLTELFLRRVMHMDREKIEKIKELGVRLATYMLEENDRQFFLSFFHHRYDRFRANLIKANLAEVKKGKPPLITLDPYITIFEDGYETASPDWRLSRDLVLIKMIEELHNKGWLTKHIDVIPEVKSEDDVEE